MLLKTFFCVLMIVFLNHFSIAQLQLKVMSYNIRLDVAADGENRWDARKDKVAALMNYYEAEFIGGQEVQHHQLEYLLTQLNGYGYIGVGRDDGNKEGEYSCIFYNKNKFDCIQQSTFWLSPTPDSVSFGWNAACRRICTYGLFQDKKTKQRVWLFNTHFDHAGDTARNESAKLVTKKVLEITSTKYPIIITGDFNSKPGETPAACMNQYFINARNASKEKPYGPEDTWNGFAFDKKPEGCIDYIFLSQHSRMRVKKFVTITDSYNMKYPSDHFPIMATIEFNN